SAETPVERRDHCAGPGGVSRQRWSVETTARAQWSRRSGVVAAEASDADPLFAAAATQRRERGGCDPAARARRLRPSGASAAAGGSALDDRAAAGIGGAASAQEDRDGDDDEPGQAQSDADPGRRPVAQARGDDDAAE